MTKIETDITKTDTITVMIVEKGKENIIAEMTNILAITGLTKTTTITLETMVIITTKTKESENQ